MGDVEGWLNNCTTENQHTLQVNRHEYQYCSAAYSKSLQDHFKMISEYSVAVLCLVIISGISSWEFGKGASMKDVRKILSFSTHRLPVSEKFDLLQMKVNTCVRICLTRPLCLPDVFLWMPPNHYCVLFTTLRYFSYSMHGFHGRYLVKFEDAILYWLGRMKANLLMKSNARIFWSFCILLFTRIPDRPIWRKVKRFSE